MTRTLRLLALAATVALPAAALAAEPTGAPGYLNEPDAPLVPPTLYDTGSAEATAARQQASGYFAAAGDPLVQPSRPGDAAATQQLQRDSGYFPDADAPLVSHSTNGD